MDGLSALTHISQASAPFLLVLALWAFLSGRVVPRWVYDRSEKQSEEWKQLAQGYQRTAERLASVAEEQQRAAPK